MKKQLAIEINDRRMSALSILEGAVTELKTVSCADKSDSGYKETLKNLLTSIGSLDVFDTFSCSYSGEECALVPMMLFAESDAESFLNFTRHERVLRDEIDYNRISEWGIVNVYRIPMWVKSALIIKIPRVVIQHELTHCLHFLNTGSTIPQRVLVLLHESHFGMIIRKDGIIHYAGYQNYQAPEDVLYHLLYAFQQLNGTNKGEIFFHASSPELQVIAEKVVAESVKMEVFRQQSLTVKLHEHILFQQLCV